ncbi:MAG: hypothetical protein KGI54_10705 [Pseudomonadota bacterium]|nr:hypothetical protein [Pseudomonadota bacterium]
MRESNLHSTGGHINPVSFFYLLDLLIDAGFENLTISLDKFKAHLVSAIFSRFAYKDFF